MTGTGSLNGTALTEATVTLTMTADITGVMSVPPVWRLVDHIDIIPGTARERPMGA